MTWIKLDDQVLDHPDMLGLTDGAFRLWVAGLTYASRHLTDGRIPARSLPVIAVVLDKPARADAYAGELVEHGLWTETALGFEIDSYLDHQRSRAQVEAERERDRDRKAKARERKAAR